MQLSILHGNNGAAVQTEPSAALASLANQLIRRQGALSSGWGGGGDGGEGERRQIRRRLSGTVVNCRSPQRFGSSETKE